MLFMLVTTITAMILNVRNFYKSGSYLLLAVGGILLVLAIWLTLEGVVRFARIRAETPSAIKAAL
jgi:carbon starvation protein